MFASGVIVLEGMRKSCAEISTALLPFDWLGAKESQDFLMPRVASLQQIDLRPGTAYSLQVSWKEERGFVGGGFCQWNLSDDLKWLPTVEEVQLWICLRDSEGSGWKAYAGTVARLSHI